MLWIITNSLFWFIQIALLKTSDAFYYKPALKFVKTIANDTTGNLRDPSAAVFDSVGGRWHFWVDYMPGSTKPGWHSFQHHYSAEKIEGPWTNHGLAINHSTDPKAWDYAGTFSPSVIFAEDEKLWYLFYSASGANQSKLSTCAQMVASSKSPDGPWTKLGLVGAPTGSNDSNWTRSWNARRLDSGRALIVNGRKGYWTKGVKAKAWAQEGVYFPVNSKSFKPPYQEWGHNPIFPAPNNGYENCEFFMGPKGEAGYPKGLLHVVCNWHSNHKGGTNPHFVTDPMSYALNWTFVESINFGALEPTPVYHGVPGDAAEVNQFIARVEHGNRITVGLYNLTWIKPSQIQ